MRPFAPTPRDSPTAPPASVRSRRGTTPGRGMSRVICADPGNVHIVAAMPAISYEEFLKSKAPVALDRGYSGKLNLNPNLKPHARDIAQWMIRGGNRACFASYGLHKTSIQLQVCESLLDAKQGKSALIVCPLGVRREFIKEAAARKFRRTPVYCATNEDRSRPVSCAWK